MPQHGGGHPLRGRRRADHEGGARPVQPRRAAAASARAAASRRRPPSGAAKPVARVRSGERVLRARTPPRAPRPPARPPRSGRRRRAVRRGRPARRRAGAGAAAATRPPAGRASSGWRWAPASARAPSSAATPSAASSGTGETGRAGGRRAGKRKPAAVPRGGMTRDGRESEIPWLPAGRGDGTFRGHEWMDSLYSVGTSVRGAPAVRGTRPRPPRPCAARRAWTGRAGAPGGRATRAAAGRAAARRRPRPAPPGSPGGTRQRGARPGGRLSRAPSDVRHHHRPPARHRLQRRQRHALPARRQDDQVGGLVPGHGCRRRPPRTARTPGARARSRSWSGPSPTSTSRAPGHPPRARPPRPRSRTSCPFCRHSRPTHTTSGAARIDRPGSSARPYGLDGGRVEALGVDAVGDRRSSARRPRRATPVARSASLTHTTRDAQRAPHRSQPQRERRGDAADRLERPGVRLEHGRDPPPHGEPAGQSRPSRCARAPGRAVRPRPAGRAGVPLRTRVGPGERVAAPVPYVGAERRAARAASGPSGQATVTCRPAASWARARSVTTRATPPSTGWREVQDPRRRGGGLAGACAVSSLTDGARDGRERAYCAGVDGDEEHAGPRRVPLGNEPEGQLVTTRSQRLSEFEHVGVAAEGLRGRGHVLRAGTPAALARRGSGDRELRMTGVALSGKECDVLATGVRQEVRNSSRYPYLFDETRQVCRNGEAGLR